MTDPGVADVVIIGAGVVGTAIARTIAGYELTCVLVDAAGDVGTGTTKANTAILHTGFDTVPGSLESRLLRRGSGLLHDYARRAGIPVERTGALVVAWTDEQEAALPGIVGKAHRNGCLAVRLMATADLYRAERELGPGARGAVQVPGESIICPWTTPLAYATEALREGVRLRLGTRVTGVRSDVRGHQVATTGGALRCHWLINAAGLESDRIDAMLGGGAFTIAPRRGELIVFDKLARPLLGSILLPVPTARTKGVLVAPTVYGNVLLGPTAEDVADRTDTATTAAGLAATLHTVCCSNAFVTKLNPLGSALAYSTYLGGSADDYAYGIAVDTSGNAYTTGFTSSTDFPTTPGAFQTTRVIYDAFVSKLNPNGSALVYSTYFYGGPALA